MIRLTAKELARLRPDLVQGLRTLHDTDDDQTGDDAVSVNELAAQLFPRRPAADDRAEEAALAYYLGLETDADDTGKTPANLTPKSPWPSLGESAQLCGVERSVLTDELIKARVRWLKKPAFTAVRNELEQLLRSQGQVMTTTEAALALLAMRGCAIQDEAERMRLSGAVLRAALEAESHLEQARFECFDHSPSMLIASSSDWADYARQLGNIADTCALAEPLMPPARALEALEAIRPATAVLCDSQQETGAGPMSATRLLRLSTSASRKAALSSRQEIYSRGMPALQALRQSLGALVGARDLSVAELQERVRGRYGNRIGIPNNNFPDRLNLFACA